MQNILQLLNFIRTTIISQLMALNDINNGIINFIERSKTTTDKNIYIDEMIFRLKKIYNILGRDFFKKFKIQCMSSTEFINLNYEDKIIFYDSVNKKIFGVFKLLIQYLDGYFSLAKTINNYIKC